MIVHSRIFSTDTHFRSGKQHLSHNLRKYIYFLDSAEMCAYLHALQKLHFQLVILCEHRGMDCMGLILLAKRILAFQ